MSVALREKFDALYDAAMFRPRLGAAIVALSFGTAFLEGVGLGFLLPIIQLAQSSAPAESGNRLLEAFVWVYSSLGIPFTLEYLVLGIAGVMTVRFTITFLTDWLRAILSLSYQQNLRQRFFEAIMYGPIEYIDSAGSDELLNSFITETYRSTGIVMAVYNVLQIGLRGLVYLAIATILSPFLTLLALAGLGLSTGFVRYVLEPAYVVGDEVAEANDRIQSVSQTGIQGMRDVRLFTMREETVQRLRDILDDYVGTSIRLRRNQSAMNNLNQLSNALVVFGLVYVGFRFTVLSLTELGVFLFAVFRLSPVVNRINTSVYNLDGQLPHFVRVRSRIQELEAKASPAINGQKSIDSVGILEFDQVSFSYEHSSDVLEDVSFSVGRGEKVAFVGRSGAGKSTIVSLLTRLQEPDSGRIVADGVPIKEFDIERWREQLAIVRQNPYIFDGSLRENVTIGNRGATRAEIEEACEIAQVNEFLPTLPNGYETELGEDGVRLSGGQKQRIAIARAILKDADVLVLDEATSELDTGIEQDVYEGIRAMEGQYASISIAHRLSTVDDADRIYTIVDGSIVEVGTHDELLDDDGMYASLYTRQSNR